MNKSLKELTPPDAIKIAEAATGIHGWHLSDRDGLSYTSLAVNDKTSFDIKSDGCVRFEQLDDDYEVIDSNWINVNATVDMIKRLGYSLDFTQY